MTPPSLIVCERTGKWAAALAPHLPSGLRPRQTRSLVESLALLAQAPSSIVALEATRQNTPGVLRALGEIERNDPLARALIVADRECESYEWLYREAGAVHFCVSPRESQAIARLCVRYLERSGARREDLAARIWNTLPWNDVA